MNNYFTDSHCHIYSEYYENIDEVIKLAENNNVKRFINNGTDRNSNIEVLNLINKYPHMYGAIGIHPENVNDYTMDDIKFIEDKLNNKKVIAIGEIGLDYHYTKDDKDKQIKLFELQLSLAEKYHIPVIIHSRDATLDTINTLKKFKVRGIIHSFSGSIETAREYIKMGYLLGINGVITFKNANLKDVYKDIDLNHIVIETDSPYLTPEPFRGKQNNSSHIIDIANFISNLKDVSLDELARITNSNLEQTFNFNVDN